MFLHFFLAPFIFLLCIVHHLSYPACAGFAPCGAGDPASRDGACGAGLFRCSAQSDLRVCSFLSSLGKKETNQRKKPPTSRNLPELRGGRMLSRKCFRRTCRFLFGHTSWRTTYGCETHPPAPPPAALSGRGIGKFLMVGFIYRYLAFGLTVSVYSQTQDTAPTRALLVDAACLAIHNLGAPVRGAVTRKARASRVLLDRRYTYPAISLGIFSISMPVH